jgi:hypothetical protein
MGGYTNYNYKPCCPTLNPIVQLTNPSIVNVVELESDENKYVFNSTTYDPNTRYGLEIGTYVLKNIPESHAVALLNNGKKDTITYTGNNKIASYLDISNPGFDYDFYYGDVTIQVYGNFDKISIYCLNHGYMGGENLFIYTKNIMPIKTIKTTFSESQKLLNLTSCYTCNYKPPSTIQYGNKHDSYNRVLRRRRGQSLNQKII